VIRRWLLVVALPLLLTGALAACSSDDSERSDGSADGDAPAEAGGTSDDSTPAGGSSTEGAAPSEPAPCDPARPVPAGQTREVLVVDGVERSYLLDVPDTYDGSSAVPLILDLHGSGSSAEQQVLYSGLPAAAAEVGAIVASLDGTGTPQGFGISPTSRDVPVVIQLLDELEARFCIDADRIGSTGISNGSATSSILACALDGRLASIGMVAATVGPFDCDEAERVSVIAFHGTDDETVPYGGGDVSSDSGGAANALDVRPAEDQIREWAAQDGCDAGPATDQVAHDVRQWSFEGCEAGTAVVFYRIEGTGHTWPGSPVPFDILEARLGPNTDSVHAAELIVDFIATHPRQT
jgi:polyhydroxybutyrate depolymerase